MIAGGEKGSVSRFLQRIEDMAARMPGKPAITYQDSIFTYAGLMDEIARSDAPAGVRGRRAPLTSDDPLEIILHILRCWHSRCIPAVLQRHPSIDLAPAILADEDSRGTTADEAFIMTTSGTTGSPKAVVLPGSSLIANVENIGRQLRISDHDRVLVALPLMQAAGLVGCALTSLYHGATVDLFPVNTPPPVLQKHLRAQGTTFLQGPPSFMRLFAAYWNRIPFGNIRAVAVGGESMSRSLPATVQEMFPDALRQTIYGLTEAGPRVSHCSLDDARVLDGYVGVPFPHIGWELRGRMEGRDTGILHIKGPSVMTGYITVQGGFEPVPADGYHCTNDLMRTSEDGGFHFCGRANICFKVGGKLVNPYMIERLLLGLEGVRQVLYHPEPDDILGFVAAADIVVEETIPLSKQDVLSFCRRSLLPHEIPRRITFRDSLPTTASGKLSRTTFPWRPSGGSP